MEMLLEGIKSVKYDAGVKLPSKRALPSCHSVTRVTVSHAVGTLGCVGYVLAVVGQHEKAGGGSECSGL